MALELITQAGPDHGHRLMLEKLFKSTTGQLRIASAYVTESDILVESKGRRIQLLTSLIPMDIISGATSLNALRSIVDAKIECRGVTNGSRLHAKVYIFGDEVAIVTSANLTGSGLDRNIEVGVRFDGPTVRLLVEWFDACWDKASKIDEGVLSAWEQATKALRRQFAWLRRKAAKKPPLPNETSPGVSSRAALRKLSKNPGQSFVCNTNRLHSLDASDERLMKRYRYATVWETFKFEPHMERVKEGDTIFMFAKGVGIIAIGRATGGCQVLQRGDPGRLRDLAGYDVEWRVPVEEWQVWDEESAFEWTMPNASFVHMKDEKYRHIRDAIFKHFLRA